MGSPVYFLFIYVLFFYPMTDADTPFAVQVQVALYIVTDLICNLNASKFKAAQSAYNQKHLCALLWIFPSISVHASSFYTLWL
jgi:hypothetical protein